MSDKARPPGKGSLVIDAALLASAPENDLALASLIETSGKETVDELQSIAMGHRKDVPPSARKRAISLLSTSRVLTVDHFESLLDEPDTGIRLQALYGLSYVGGKEACALLCGVVEDTDRDEVEIAHAVRLLGAIGDMEIARRLEAWSSTINSLELGLVVKRALESIRRWHLDRLASMESALSQEPRRANRSAAPRVRTTFGNTSKGS